MKKKLLVLGANLLVLGIALTGGLASTNSGTIVSDPEVLTKITGAACANYQSQTCHFTGCDSCSASIAGGLGSKGTDAGQVDCSSRAGWTCGGCHQYTSCGG